MHALLIQTPVGPERQAIRRSRCCLPLVTRRRLPRVCDFGAQSHGLHLRCLRFATAVTRALRKTRFRAVASLTRAGLDPQDLFGRFPKRLISRHLFLLPRALLGARHVSHCCIVMRTHSDRCHPENYGHTFGDRLKSLVQRTSVEARSSQQFVDAKRGTLALA